MPLAIVASHARLVTAINHFPGGYHRDYFAVRTLATAFLGAPSPATATPLAQELSIVLHRWGAGVRKAPPVQPVTALVTALLSAGLLPLLTSLSALTLPMLSITAAGGHSIRAVTTGICSTFDRQLLNAMNLISSGFLDGNTNITYPMKVLLLLTGLMPALDSRVRMGLGQAGLPGINTTRFLMPPSPISGEALKLTRLPFFLADCYSRHAPLLSGAVAASLYPALASEPGRIFDVLLFMQGSTKLPLLSMTPYDPHWYCIP